MILQKPDIDAGRSFDWGKPSDDYARYRDIYPPVLYDRLAALGIGVRGQRVLDLGTGTGVLPRNMYPFGARFTGVDISAGQIEAVRRLAADAGTDIEFLIGAAEDMRFPSVTFDAATACQCFIYFDTAPFLPLLSTVLKVGGLLATVLLNRLSDESRIAAAIACIFL